jgi:hypothetical protein
MRVSMRQVSLAPAFLAAILFCFCSVSFPAFASGDDKPSSSTAARPDREKKVFTNDDIDRMWPKQKPASNAPQITPARPIGFEAQQGASSSSRNARTTVAVTNPESDPLWYAEQVRLLSAELDRISAKEQFLRDFRASGNAPGAGTGLQLNAPCEGFTTDNAILQMALRRQEIEQQLADLEDVAQRNDMPAGILRDATAIFDAAQKPTTRLQQQMSIELRQAQLAAELEGVHNELSDMSAQASAAGANLLPPTPGFGGNMTTDLIERLDNRASEIKSALDEADDAARRAGVAQSTISAQ